MKKLLSRKFIARISRNSNQQWMVVSLIWSMVFVGLIVGLWRAGEKSVSDVNQVEEEVINENSLLSGEDKELHMFRQQSCLLRAIDREGLASVPEDFFAVDGDETVILSDWQPLVPSLISEARAAYERQLAEIEVADVNVFFYNTRSTYEDHDMSFEEADALAFTTIQNVRNDVVAGVLTVEEAREQLASNEDLAKLDWNLVNNVGSINERAPVADLFYNQLYLDAIDQIEESGVTQVIRSPGSHEEYPESSFSEGFGAGPAHNGYYFFLVIENKTDGYLEPFIVWQNKEYERCGL